uniref:magnesium transporter n=1 Tax=Angelakisella sp. TaxID=1935177 RepID=UPI004026FEF1
MNQEILELLAEKKYSAVKQLIGQMEEADLAKLFEELENEEDADQFNRLFRLLPKETAAEVFSYMEPEIQEKIVRTLTDTELQHILDDLFMDDYVDLVEEMPANVVKRVMQNTTPANRKLINQYLKYPEDSAGSLMTNEYVYFRSGITVAKAFEIIREYGVDKETIYTCYVTSSRKELLGVVTVREMLLTAPETIIDTLMDTNPIHVHTHDDQEEIAKMFSRYDMLAMPVVDSENRIVGIITIDDAVDVIQDENTEDFEKMAGMTPSDNTYLRTSAFNLAKNRIPWLVFLMIPAMITGALMEYYEAAFVSIPILVTFIPQITGTGGNCGSQSSTMIIRGLALDEITPKDILKVWWKELRVALICGAALSLVNFIRIIVQYHDLQVAVVVSVTLILTVCIAKSMGCVLPILAKLAHVDPAIMASPLITTITDALSILVYFNFALWYLPGRLG